MNKNIFTKEEIVYLKMNYKNQTRKELAINLNRSLTGIFLNLKRLGLKAKRDNSRNKNEKNPMWKGDKAKIKAIHKWLRKHMPKPKFCIYCRKRKPYDIANLKGNKYRRNISDYAWLCRSCHMKLDYALGVRK